MKQLLAAGAALALACSAAVAATNTTNAAPHSPRDFQNKMQKYGGKHADIIFDGDSIMNRWETTGRALWSQRYASMAADFGIEGDRTEHVLYRLQHGQVDGIDPKAVVLMIGTNNSGQNSAEEIADGIKAILGEYETRCPNAHIILLGIFPRGERPENGQRKKVAAVNEIIKSLTSDKRVTYIDISAKMIEADGTISRDMMPDFVHPTAKGYQIWADAIQPTLDQYVPAKKQ